MDDTQAGIIGGLIIGLVFSLFAICITSDIQQKHTLMEIRPYTNLKCETVYTKMTNEQIKYCNYYIKNGGKQ